MELKEYSETIKNELTLEEIYNLLASFGADPVMQNGIIMCRTICHGGHSHKLYYYENTHLFKCYTDCYDTFDVFELIIKIKKQDGIEIPLPQAVNFIANYYGLPPREENFEAQDELQDWKIFNKYEKSVASEKEEKIVEMKIFDDKILRYLPHPRIGPWEREGISREVMEHCGICYDPSAQGIVIPHFDKDGQLVGIRERTLIKENEDTGKYKPAILNYQMYNHPLGFNLYNLNNSKNMISQIKKVIVFEGEKSCLLYQSYFGIENDISVAVCGSSFTKYQVDLLREAGAEEICIAFDKQFKEIGDDEWKNWTKKLKDIHKKYGSLVQVTFMFDLKNNIGYKDSPIDCGKEIFLKMFNERVAL